MRVECAEELLGKATLPQDIHIQSTLQNGLQQVWETVEHSSQQSKDKDGNLHPKRSFKTRLIRPLPILNNQTILDSVSFPDSH